VLCRWQFSSGAGGLSDGGYASAVAAPAAVASAAANESVDDEWD